MTNILHCLFVVLSHLFLLVIIQAVADFLLQICKHVGDNLESICNEFLAEYTDDIIDQLVDQYLNPEEVCKAITACP